RLVSEGSSGVCFSDLEPVDPGPPSNNSRIGSRNFEATIEVSGPDATIIGGWTGVDGFPRGAFRVKGHAQRQGRSIRLDHATVRRSEGRRVGERGRRGR